MHTWFVVLLLGNLVAAFWVYQDAMVNSDDSEVLWALVVVVAGFVLGLLLYLLLGRAQDSRRSRGSPTDDAGSDGPTNVDDRRGPFN